MKEIVEKNLSGSTDQECFVFGLYFGCPLERPKNDCPMICFRKLNPATVMKVINEMSEDKINILVDEHRKCLFKRTVG